MTWRPGFAVGAATALYALVFCVLGADRYATFHSGTDLGLFAQTIASTGAGFSNTFEGGNHFAFHFSPILALCAPALWLAHSALALVFIQAIATALVAPAIYAFARRRTTDANAALLAVVVLLYPPLQGVTFTDFHETAFLPAALAWMLWAVDARRFGWAAVFAAVALACKEDQAVTLAFLGCAGAVYFLRRGDRAAATFAGALAAVSALVFAGYFAIVRPMAAPAKGWVPAHFYEWAGYTSSVPLAAQITGRLTYLLEAFVPLLFVPLRSKWVLLALPGLFEVLASREPLMYTMGQHYAGIWVPYVLIAFADGGAALLENRPNGRRWIAGCAAVCALVLAFFSPLHLGHFLRPLDAQDAQTEAFIASLPRDARIGTYDEIYAHLGFYPNAQVGLRGSPQYVIANDTYASAAWNGRWLPELRRDLRDGTYRVAASQNGVTLYERR